MWRVLIALFLLMLPVSADASGITTSGRNLIQPNGSVYRPYGFNIWGDTGQDFDVVNANITSYLPGVNFVRIYIYDYREDQGFVNEVNALTAKGVVVMIEDAAKCITSPPVACSNETYANPYTLIGAALTNAENWYTFMGNTFKNNGLVVLESENEPDNVDEGSAQLAAYQNMIEGEYNAFRATGATNLFVFCTPGGPDINGVEFTSGFTGGAPTNVAFDMHWYPVGWSGSGITQATNGLNSQLSGFQNVFPGPVFIGESGESTSGTGGAGDSNGVETIQAAINAVNSGQIPGYIYFQWYSDGVTSTFGNDSIFASQAGSADNSDIFGNSTTCVNDDSVGCGFVIKNFIATSPGAILGGGGGNCILTDGVCLTQAQVTAIANAINTTQTSEVGAECFGGTCFPQTALAGDSLVTTAIGTINTTPQVLLDSAGNTWTLTPGIPCQTNGADWWWAGLTVSPAVPGQPATTCGYVMDMRLLSNGHVWIEWAKQGGWWDATAYGDGCYFGSDSSGNGNCPNIGPYLQGDPGPGPNNVPSGGGGGSPGGNTTWNPSDDSGITLTNGNLTATSAAATASSVRSTTSRSTGSYCAEIAMTTLTANWAVGIADSAFVLTNASGMGSDTNAIAFDPNTGSNQGVFFNNIVLSSGASTSSNGDFATICINIATSSFWVTDAVMRAASHPWNNSATANPATGTGGLSWSGMSCPCYIAFNEFDANGVATLNTTGPFQVAVPSGFSTWDSSVAGHVQFILVGN